MCKKSAIDWTMKHCCETCPNSHSRCIESCETYKFAIEAFMDGHKAAMEEVGKPIGWVCSPAFISEWHTADVPTKPINTLVLGLIKHYNSKKYCLVKWNGEWWYNANTYNDEVKLLLWTELPNTPKENKSQIKEN